MVGHKGCPDGGAFEIFEIREHNYCFMRCACGAVVGGERVEREIASLLRTKVRPTVRRA